MSSTDTLYFAKSTVFCIGRLLVILPLFLTLTSCKAYRNNELKSEPQHANIEETLRLFDASFGYFSTHIVDDRIYNEDSWRYGFGVSDPHYRQRMILLRDHFPEYFNQFTLFERSQRTNALASVPVGIAFELRAEISEVRSLAGQPSQQNVIHMAWRLDAVSAPDVVRSMLALIKGAEEAISDGDMTTQSTDDDQLKLKHFFEGLSFKRVGGQFIGLGTSDHAPFLQVLRGMLNSGVYVNPALERSSTPEANPYVPGSETELYSGEGRSIKQGEGIGDLIALVLNKTGAVRSLAQIIVTQFVINPLGEEALAKFAPGLRPVVWGHCIQGCDQVQRIASELRGGISESKDTNPNYQIKSWQLVRGKDPDLFDRARRRMIEEGI